MKRIDAELADEEVEVGDLAMSEHMMSMEGEMLKGSSYRS
jgi:hypothetical protein